jgi:hypothetical protein
MKNLDDNILYRYCILLIVYSYILPRSTVIVRVYFCAICYHLLSKINYNLSDIYYKCRQHYIYQ